MFSINLQCRWDSWPSHLPSLLKVRNRIQVRTKSRPINDISYQYLARPDSHGRLNFVAGDIALYENGTFNVMIPNNWLNMILFVAALTRLCRCSPLAEKTCIIPWHTPPNLTVFLVHLVLYSFMFRKLNNNGCTCLIFFLQNFPYFWPL